MKRFLFLFLPGFPWIVSAQSEVYFKQPTAENRVLGQDFQGLMLLQTGQLNQVHYRDDGADNRVNVVQQGINNELDLELLGIDNQVVVRQKGHNNLMQWGAFRQNGSQLEVSQSGHNNQLIREGNAAGVGVPMRIEQTGGIQLVIKNGF